MRTVFGYEDETTSKTLSQKVKDLCEDLGMDEVSSDEDGVDFSFSTDEGEKGMVSIDFDADRIVVERWSSDGTTTDEFEGDEGDTLDNVRLSLV